MELPYKSHLLYKLRLAIIVNGTFSILLSIINLVDTGRSYQELWVWHLLFAGLSVVICIFDVIKWALQKLRDPDNEPIWPVSKVMAVDIVLAAIFICLYPGEITACYSYSYDYFNPVTRAYASLTALAAALLHAYIFWKQLMAVKKAEWLKSIQQQICRCTSPAAHVHCESQSTTQQPQIDSSNDSQLFPQVDLDSGLFPTDIEAAAESSNESNRLLTPPSESSNTAANTTASHQHYGAFGYDYIADQSTNDDLCKKKNKRNKGRLLAKGHMPVLVDIEASTME